MGCERLFKISPIPEFHPHHVVTPSPIPGTSSLRRHPRHVVTPTPSPSRHSEFHHRHVVTPSPILVLSSLRVHPRHVVTPSSIPVTLSLRVPSPSRCHSESHPRPQRRKNSRSRLVIFFQGIHSHSYFVLCIFLKSFVSLSSVPLLIANLIYAGLLKLVYLCMR
jgi:hypothetical protein